MGETTRRADIQGLRAVAVLLVVLFHAGLPIDGGFIGVDVFFVISGFVITSLLLRELDRTGTLSFAAFYARRVRRILPALALTTVVVAVGSLGAVSEPIRATTARTGVAASLFVSNIFLYRSPNGYFDAAPTLNPLLHMWSLSVEEQFYFVFPAVLAVGALIARRIRPGSRWALGLVIGAVALVSFAIGLYTTNAGPDPATFNSQFAFYMAPARAWEFAVGALLGVGAIRLARIPRTTAIGFGIIGAALVGIGAFTIDGTTPFPGTAALLPVVGTALLLAAGTATTAGVSGLLGIRPMIWIGDRSYSWYLWHWPIIVFAAALWPGNDRIKLIAAAASLLPAWLSYRWIERPIHTNARWQGRRAFALASACIVVPIVACVALLRAPLPAADAATQSFLTASRTHHADKVRGCNRGLPVSDQPARCTWGVANPKGSIVLLGDSNAGQFTEPVARAANRLGYNFSVATFPTCPFVDLNVRAPKLRTSECRRFVTTTVDELVADPPALVVLASSTPIYLSTDTVTFANPATGTVSSSTAEKSAAWNGGLERVLGQLGRGGIPTLVVHTIPQWLEWDSRDCAVVRVYLSPESCGASQTRGAVAEFRQAALTAEERAVRAVPSSSEIDFVTQLCSATTCSTNRGNVWTYRDGRHLSVRGSLGLTDEFALALRSALSRGR